MLFLYLIDFGYICRFWVVALAETVLLIWISAKNIGFSARK